jgi:AraC-like DNA-binding protein
MGQSVYSPSEALRPFIRSFTIEEKTESAIYKVLPGTTTVMGFQFRGALSIVTPAPKTPNPQLLTMANSPQLKFSSEPISFTPPDAASTPPAPDTPRNALDTPLTPSGITGLSDSFRFFRNSPGTGTLLVHFTETGAAHFFTTPIHLLFNGSYSLGDLIPASETSHLEEQLTAAADNAARIAVIEHWLIKRLRHQKKDLQIEAAIARIYAAKGQLRIAALGQELYISPSRLEKRFRALVGTTPKKFAGLVRLQAIVNATPLDGDLTSLAYEAGYFDQAHFIHDFTAYTGLTPADFFRNHPTR